MNNEVIQEPRPAEDAPHPYQPLIDLAADARDLLAAHLRETRQENIWNWARRLFFAFIALLGLGLWIATAGPIYGLRSAPPPSAIGVVQIHGEISETTLTSAQHLVPLIHTACRSSKIKAVVLDIQSPGGSPNSAERIAAALDTCRPKDKPAKPVLAVIDGVGASAAYLIAVHADEIIANRFAMVGSIGVILSKLEYGDGLARLGVGVKQYVSGNMKGMLSPSREDTPEQAAVAQALVNTSAAVFRAMVEERRGDVLTAPPEELYSGRVWLADEAKAMGLIDEVNVIEAVLAERFKGTPTHRYVPTRSLEERLSAEGFIDALSASIVAQLFARGEGEVVIR